MTVDGPKPGRTAGWAFRVRTGSVFLRAAHLLGASVLAGAYLLGVDDPRLPLWWGVAGGSGVLLLAAELLRHPSLFREVAGASTVLKLLLLGALFAVPAAAPAVMSAAFVVAVLGAHFPKVWRHRRIL